jgi:hypothetical protein
MCGGTCALLLTFVPTEGGLCVALWEVGRHWRSERKSRDDCVQKRKTGLALDPSDDNLPKHTIRVTLVVAQYADSATGDARGWLALSGLHAVRVIRGLQCKHMRADVLRRQEKEIRKGAVTGLESQKFRAAQEFGAATDKEPQRKRQAVFHQSFCIR